MSVKQLARGPLGTGNSSVDPFPFGGPPNLPVGPSGEHKRRRSPNCGTLSKSRIEGSRGAKKKMNGLPTSTKRRSTSDSASFPGQRCNTRGRCWNSSTDFVKKGISHKKKSKIWKMILLQAEEQLQKKWYHFWWSWGEDCYTTCLIRRIRIQHTSIAF